jgi:hypothetical protein
MPARSGNLEITLVIMAESLPVAVRGRWRQGTRFVVRTARRTLVESLYLLTAPVIAFVGLLLVLGGVCLATVGLLRPGKSRPAAGALVPARWFADLERWRIATVRSLAVKAAGGGGRPRPKEITASDPGLWLDAAHTVVGAPGCPGHRGGDGAVVVRRARHGDVRRAGAVPAGRPRPAFRGLRECGGFISTLGSTPRISCIPGTSGNLILAIPQEFTTSLQLPNGKLLSCATRQ